MGIVLLQTQEEAPIDTKQEVISYCSIYKYNHVAFLEEAQRS